jgi:hypothetical protein
MEDLGLYGRMTKMNGKGTGWDGVDWINPYLANVENRVSF